MKRHLAGGAPAASPIRALLLAAVVTATALAGPPERGRDHDRGEPEATNAIRVPLFDGRINVGEITDALAGSIHVDLKPGILDKLRRLDWSINTKSLLGRTQLAAIETISGGSLSLDVRGDELVVGVSGEGLSRLADSLDAAKDNLLANLPFASTGAPTSFGVTFLTDGEPPVQLLELEDVPERVVLLIHGLDDPGWMFNDLIPSLHERGGAAARFDYPNDGPISESAVLLASSLRDLRAAGVERVDVIAHSMGGLVTRDVLTRKEFYGGDGAGDDELPALDRLIMVGTPNHGSHCARFRALLEVREQAVRAIRGDNAPGRAEVDGAGEAGADLLPDSAYLHELNALPLATHTQHTIIAGQVSPLEASVVENWARRISSAVDSDDAPEWWRDFVNETVGEEVPEFINNASGALGDGVVTIESARLDGVDDFTIVIGNHMSMLYKPGDDHDPPPSIEIILDRLGQ